MGVGDEVGARVVVNALRARSQESECIVATHRNADPDALASSLIMMRVCRWLGYRRACAVYPEGLSRASKRIIEESGVGVEECAGQGSASSEIVVVIVDASNRSQLGDSAGLIDRARAVVVIDHHEAGDLLPLAEAAYHKPGAASTTQLALEVARAAGAPLDPAMRTVALAGILYDTRRFSFTDADALRWASALVEGGADYAIAVRMLQGERGERTLDFSERWARLRAAQRVRLGRFCKEYIVAVTHVGSFESSAARSLIDLGADVAIVATMRGQEVRVAVRVSRRAAQAGVTASKLAAYIAERYGGSGGGHEQAGMAHLNVDDVELEDIVEELARSIPGKAGRLCVEARGVQAGEARRPGEG